jgi:hypothetical protein
VTTQPLLLHETQQRCQMRPRCPRTPVHDVPGLYTLAGGERTRSAKRGVVKKATVFFKLLAVAMHLNPATLLSISVIAQVHLGLISFVRLALAELD